MHLDIVNQFDRGSIMPGKTLIKNLQPGIEIIISGYYGTIPNVVHFIGPIVKNEWGACPTNKERRGRCSDKSIVSVRPTAHMHMRLICLTCWTETAHQVAPEGIITA